MPSTQTNGSRTKPADVRREELMDAAQALFVQKGVAATSMDDIVTAAGVSKGGFYHHFASKDALLTALQDRLIDRYLSKVVAAQDALPEGDWRGRMDVWLDVSVNSYFTDLALHDVVFHEFSPIDRREMNENVVVDQFAHFLAAGTTAGAWHVERPRLTAVMLFHAWHGACDEAVLSPESIDMAGLLETLKQFFVRVVLSAE